MNTIIENFRNSDKDGAFLFPSSGEFVWDAGPGAGDGSNVATWLRQQGYEVVKNWDCGRNGWAVTKCGLKVSTNGYFCRVPKLTLTEIQTVPHGETLGQEDLDYANKLLAEGHPYEYVWGCIRAWAHEINRVSWAETKDAQRFEKWSY